MAKPAISGTSRNKDIGNILVHTNQEKDGLYLFANPSGPIFFTSDWIHIGLAFCLHDTDFILHRTKVIYTTPFRLALQ